MDLLRSREKDPLSAKYSTFPGWHSSHIYQLNSSTAADLQYPTNYNSSTAESDYTGKVRKLRSNKGRYKEGDIHEQLEEWERTWPINCRGREEKKQQDYASFYHHSLSNKTSGFEVEERRSGIEKVLGCGETKEQSQPTSHNRHQADLREREQWRDWSTSLNMGSIFPIVWFREPPSYTAPPAYSHPKDWDKKAGIRNAPKQEHTESFKEQTMECRKENFTDSTETRRNPNNGHYLQKHNQNTERYCLQASNTVLQYTAINTKPSSHALLQHRDSSEITYPDVSRTRQNKLSWRKGGETVFCLVSRMGEVSGLASSPEEPLKPHVLPLITDPKPDGRTNTPWSNDNSRQNQEEYPRDEAVRQLHGSLMSEEFGRASLEHTGGDQRSSSIPDFSNAIKPKENKQELQCYAQRNDSPSHCLTQKSYRDEKPFKEILEKFPLWKEPKYQRQRNEQSQGINSVVTNTKDSSRSTQDRQKSLVVIDATRVVVKVELVLLPEKEHVQYVSLTEDSLWSRTRDELKQNSSVVASQETQTYSTVGEERILGRPHEYPRTGLQTYSQEHIRSSGTNLVDPITGVEDSPSAAETVEQGLVGQPWSGTTLDNNEGRMKEEPEAALEGFQTNAKSTPEDSEQTEKTTVQTKEATNQEQEPTLDDRVVKHRIKKDNENHQKDTLPEDSSAEENLSDEKEDMEELVSDGKDDREELVSVGKDDREELVSDGKDDREELVSDGKDDREQLVSDGKDDREELVSDGKDDREELVSVGKDDREELVLDCSILLPKSRAREIQHKVVLSPIEGFSTLRRSSSSPHLLFSSSSRTWDGSHTENEASSTNTNGPQSSSLPFLYSSASEDPCRSIAEVLLCTPSLPELKAEEPHAISLWDAVSRIRRHTAPDSETEEEEDLLHHRLSKEHE
ncbi:uncharacterized protein si:ch211-159e12.5 [Pseudorasbora parva]|uniref:uncharacterized protein si:ch211-159e12.5 n=1 Tax=Pseudorasbora parva TaxID=51549 RepID=UPI00351ED3EC